MNDKVKRGIILIIFVAITPFLFILAPLPKDYSDQTGFSQTEIICQDNVAASDIINTQGNSTGIEIYNGIAYIADGNQGVNTYDISDPDALTELDSLTTPSDVISVAINGHILALGTDGSGVRIINASDPEDLTPISFETSSSRVLSLKIDGNYLYTASGTDGFTIINITDIENPSEIGSIPSINNALEVEIEGSYAFVSAGSEGIHIINMFDRTAPYIIKTISTTYANSLKVNGHQIYVADTSGFICIDARDYNSPQITYTNTETTDYTDIAYMDNYVFAVNQDNTTVFNVNTVYDIEKLPYNLTGGFKISIEDGIIGLADKLDGFSITVACDYYQFDADFNPTFSFSLLGDGTDMEVKGNIAFISTLRSGLRIINMTDIPTASSYWGEEYNEENQKIYSMAEIGYWKGSFDLTSIEIRGNIAYITSEGDGLLTVNISDPSNPELISSFTTPLYGNSNNNFDNLIIYGDIAYFSAIGEFNDNPYLLSVNISDPSNIELMDTIFIDIFEDSGRISNIYIENDNLWVSHNSIFSESFVITIYDITDPTNFQNISQYIDNSNFLDAASFFGRFAYLIVRDPSSYEQSIQIIDFTDISNPQTVALRNIESDFLQYEIFSVESKLLATKERLFVGLDLGILIYDISTPSEIFVDQYVIVRQMKRMISTGNSLYCVGTGVFSLIKIMNGQLNDVDGDGFGYLQEVALGINSLKLDTDGDGLNDSVEIYYGMDPNLGNAKLADKDHDTLTDYKEVITTNTDPTLPDMDGDGYNDGAETNFGTDPTNPALFPSKIYGYGLLIMSILTGIFSVIMLIVFIKAFKKPFNVRVFMSHSPKDYGRYNLDALGNKISSNLKQSKHYKWSPDSTQTSTKKQSSDDETSKSKVKKADNNSPLSKDEALKDSQILLFLATDETLHSEEAKQQLSFARENEMFVVPVKSESVEWGDMATLELNRDLGVEFKMETFEESSEEVLKFIKNFQNDLTNVRDGFGKNKITFINLAERNYDLSADMIYQTTKHLVQDGQLAGAWTKDKKQFLNAKEIKKRFKKMKKIVKTGDVTILAKKIGIAEEYIPYIPHMIKISPIGGDKK